MCVLQIVGLLLPALVGDDSDIILEVKAGVGGQEAMLFTKEVFHMYTNYASYKGWSVQIVNYDATDIGNSLKFVFCLSLLCILISDYYTRFQCTDLISGHGRLEVKLVVVSDLLCVLKYLFCALVFTFSFVT